MRGDLTAADYFSTDPVIHFLKEFGDPSTDECVRRALESLKTETGGTKYGAGRAITPGAITPKTYCALIVSEAWRSCHGETPRPKNVRARKAAELLWRAADGDGHFGQEEPLARWRRHFQLANCAGQSHLRATIRRHLAVSQHFSELRDSLTNSG